MGETLMCLFIFNFLCFMLNQRYYKHLRSFSKSLWANSYIYCSTNQIKEWKRMKIFDAKTLMWYLCLFHIQLLLLHTFHRQNLFKVSFNNQIFPNLTSVNFFSLSGTMMLRMWPVIFWVQCGSSPSPSSPLDMETWCLTPTVARECVCSQELWYKHTHIAQRLHTHGSNG